MSHPFSSIQRFGSRKTSLIRSLNETREGWQEHYEIGRTSRRRAWRGSANDAPFLHDKAGVIESRDGTKWKDKLGLPSAVWLSSAKQWRDANGHIIKTQGAEDIRRCPFQIGIVSTGLIVQGAAAARTLLECKFGTLVLDEAHKARKSRGITASGEPNRLLGFMLAGAQRARHVILGTATPVQTDVEELCDLLEVLNKGADHVLGRYGSQWRRPAAAIPVLAGEKAIVDEGEAWNWLRNPNLNYRRNPAGKGFS